MREAVPAHLPVSVKCVWAGTAVRKFEIADAFNRLVHGAGSHGRTKEQGYRGNILTGRRLARFRQRLNIPVIANG